MFHLVNMYSGQDRALGVTRVIVMSWYSNGRHISSHAGGDEEITRTLLRFMRQLYESVDILRSWS